MTTIKSFKAQSVQTAIKLVNYLPKDPFMRIASFVFLWIGSVVVTAYLSNKIVTWLKGKQVSPEMQRIQTLSKKCLSTLQANGIQLDKPSIGTILERTIKFYNQRNATFTAELRQTFEAAGLEVPQEFTSVEMENLRERITTRFAEHEQFRQAAVLVCNRLAIEGAELPTRLSKVGPAIDELKQKASAHQPAANAQASADQDQAHRQQLYYLTLNRNQYSLQNKSLRKG